MTKSSMLLAAICLSGIVCANTKPAHATTIRNLVKEFRLTNPHGAWSYRWSGGLLTYILFHIEGHKGVHGWFNGLPQLNSVVVERNTTSAPVTVSNGAVVMPPDHLLLDSQSDPTGAVVRFTVPVAGTYHVRGDFEALNKFERKHPVLIQQNGKTTFAAHATSFEKKASFNLELTLAAGDTLDFISATDGVGISLGTGLAAQLIGP